MDRTGGRLSQRKPIRNRYLSPDVSLPPHFAFQFSLVTVEIHAASCHNNRQLSVAVLLNMSLYGMFTDW